MSDLPAAVFFDMDGLLVDTEGVWFEVETAAMARLGGGAWGPDHQENLVGGSLPTTVAYMLRVSGSSADPEELAEWMLEEMARRLSEGVKLMPGAVELLEEVRAAGLPVALVTSSARRLAELCLRGIGPHYFDHVVTGDDVVRTKPDPEPYLMAARLAGVAPEDCVVLEDSPNGVAAATAAGCKVVAVPGVLPVPAAPGRLVVGSLRHVDLDALRGLFDAP
ncbi:HAD family hydrolase [Thermostaphylospora chromogena]|uniref:Haloacid dehalogenase superfamily, subfamily IA, variant 3 with third motif having DD or ED/haloacid dehalogenase superfamily, subfamily IA, variant 1 with third motif having Dx(3-4)D or Dx(3-4)E n=1 Tax=Thermostaphylospora chromogena TaxID=35622 RepID=A0A1H1HJM9_9ACTN|nr:HAD family phosphatase [Thermostaphylospora chromogena]SDR25286.1 haloacid dehalogenase superfamily, subfamily IA, variant 3 with third motif having DD or ED/haloacid dehalogenase superfamily, subfamily IA, variant 1 with third motif having Dx(3-4)D or Dx(3-4)E [Thermostaphylospora chromogena]